MSRRMGAVVHARNRAQHRGRGHHDDRERRVPRLSQSVARRRRRKCDAGVVTFADLGDAARPLAIVPPHANLRGKNFHLLAGDRTRFVGEAVAVVLADSRYEAEDARALIDVAWEPLPSAQDPTTSGDASVHDDIPDNLAGRVTLSRGDVTAALGAAPRRARLTL